MRMKNTIAIAMACVLVVPILHAEPVAGMIARLKFDDEASRTAALGGFDAYRYQGFVKALEMSPGVLQEFGGYSGIAITQPDRAGGHSVLWVRPDPQRSRRFDAGPERMEYTCLWSHDERVLWLAILILSDGGAELAVEGIHLDRSGNGIYKGKEVYYHSSKVIRESIRADAFQSLVIEPSDANPGRVSVKYDLAGMPQQVIELSESEYPVDFEEEFERRLNSGPEIDELKSKIDALHAD